MSNPPLRLPTFVDRNSLEDVLRWVPSIRRAFREAALRSDHDDWSFEGEDVYKNVASLLELPGGGRRLEQLVAVADPGKRRGLDAALRRSWKSAPSRRTAGFPIAELKFLLQEDDVDAAAWWAFRLLSDHNRDGGLGKTELDELARTIEYDDGLIERLGDYWTDWQAARFDDPEADVSADDIIIEAGFTNRDPDSAAQAERSDSETTWSAALSRLQHGLASLNGYDAELSIRLRAAADEFDAIRDEVERLRTKAEGIAAARETLAASIAALRATLDLPALEWMLEAGAAVADLTWLESATSWAEAAREGISAAEVRCVEAAARHRNEDTDEADEAFLTANRKRRMTRTRIDAEATAWTQGPPAEAFQRFEATEVEPPSPAPVVISKPSTEAHAARAMQEARPDALGETPVGAAGGMSAGSALSAVQIIDETPVAAQEEPTGKVVPSGETVDDPIDAKPSSDPEILTDCPSPERESASKPVLPDQADQELASIDANPSMAAIDPLPSEHVADVAPHRPNGFDEARRVPALDAFLPDDGPRPSPEVEILEAAWRRALREGRYGLAAHTARAAAALGAHLPGDGAPLLEALALGVAVSELRVSEAVVGYSQLEPQLYAEEQYGSGAGLLARLLLIAGALRPAIFSSQTGAAEIFRLAEPGVLGSELHELADFLADMPRRGGHLEFADLVPAADAQSRRRAADTVREELLDTVDGASDRRSVYQRATSIMLSVLASGPVGEAVAAVRRRTPGASDRAETAAAWLDEDLDRRVEQLDDEARRPRRGAPLEGMARKWLMQRLGEAASLLRRWAAADRAAQGPRTGHTEEVRSRLWDLLTDAIGAFGRLTLANSDEELGSAVVTRVFMDVLRLLDGEDVDDARLTLDMLLNDDLLLSEEHPLREADKSWSIASAQRMARQISGILADEPDFDAAFQRLVAAGRFAEAATTVNRLAADGRERKDYDEQLKEESRRRRERLVPAVELLRRKLDDVLGADTARRVDLTLQTKVEELAASVSRDPDVIDFPDVERKLSDLQEQVDDVAELLLAPLLAEIEKMDPPEPVATTLRGMVDKGDLTTLREHIEAVRTGADIGASAGRRLQAFSKRFLSPGFEKLPASDRNLATLIEAASSQCDTPAADFSQLQKEDVAGATELLRAWRGLRAGKADAVAQAIPALRDLFTSLQFTSVKIVEPQTLSPARRYGLRCDPVEGRRECPVPAFGSAAKGAYALLVVDAVSVKHGSDLYNLVLRLDSPTTRPTFIIVVGGALPASRRREYMVEARKKGALEPVALIDEAAILSLASRPGRKLSDLFAIALPMGAVQPYSDAHGQTSPEMFFGRDTELTQLWDRNGSCLVYGGRQLGKTALLEQLRIRHHRPPSQVVVGGSVDGVIDLWPWLAGALRGAGVHVKASHAAAVCTSIRDWLRQDETRRLLILADEADIYLESQMAGDYQGLIKARDLMQETERRCKFVFAGLHNVQRLARQPNSPLLHFGVPLRVGPLYGPDLGEARAMLEQPMAAAGFVYGGDTLPGRVLSELGYYPSLLQTFGQTMIGRLNRTANARMPHATPLPIVVSESDIDDVLTDAQFRKDLSGKFEATLSLDERYRLITYAMLVHSMDRPGHSSALQDVEVQERALTWWPQGFAQDSTLDAFQGLLQEMVGLGVLIEADGRYAIRSSRIATMLGGRDEIERKLFEMSELPGYAKLDTGSLRRLDKDSRVPSPLTARQEGVTLAPMDAPPVQLVLGSKALGLDDLAASLEALADDELSVERLHYTTPGQMATRLEAARDRRTLVVLSGPWPGITGLTDLLRLEQVRRSGRGRRRSLQVLVAPLDVDWAELGKVDATGRFAGLDLLTLAPLGDTGLRQWLRAVTGAETTDAVSQLRELTGGYPLFLRNLEGGSPAELVECAKRVYATLRENPTTLSAIGLADPVLRQAADLVAIIGGHNGKGTDEMMTSEGIADPRAATMQLERLGILELGAKPSDERVVNPFVASILGRTSDS